MRVQTPHYWFLLVLIYFGLHALMRIALGTPLYPDEARLLEEAIAFRWTYGAEPPLYHWLQYGAFELMGPGLLALAIVKNGVLALLTFAVFFLVRPATGLRWAWIAVLSLFLLPDLAWTAQHDLSGEILAAALAALSAMALVFLRQAPSFPRYVLFGAALGLGVLSHVSFAVFAVALLVAALTLGPYRRALLSLGTIIALLIAVGIGALPVGLSGDPAFQDALLAQLLPVARAATGVEVAGETLLTTVRFCAVMIVILGIVFMSGLGAIREVPPPVMEVRRLLSRTAACGFALLLARALGTGTAISNTATLLPVLFLAAPALVLFLYPLLKSGTQHALSQKAAVVALLLLVATPLSHTFGGASEPARDQTADARVELNP